MISRWVLHVVAWPLGLYAGVCFLVFVFQRSLLYFPARAPEPALLAQARRESLEPWRDGQGALIGWRALHPDGGLGRVVVFHGNAGSAVHRVYVPRGLQAPELAQRWDIHILEYPGYGARSGAPSEDALVAAGLAALDGLAAEGRRPTVLLGESLGSGVAARCAAARPDGIDGLFLVTPLTSVADVGKVHYPFLPSFLVRDRLDAAKALRGVRVPLALMVAERDEVVPAELGRRLFDDYQGPKRLWNARGAGHNTWNSSPGNPLWREVSAFLGEHVPGLAAP